MQANEKHVLTLLALLAEQSGDKVSETRLEYLADELVSLGADRACVALKKLLESARKFPTLAEVKAVMGVAEPTARDAGLEIASRIVTTIARCGEPVGPKGIAARDAMLGPAALAIVQKMGGWALVVEQAGENMTALKAQIRDLAEAAIRTGQLEPEQTTKALPSYGEALALASAKIKPVGLPAPKRELIQKHHDQIAAIKERLERGEISNDEALELIALYEQQLKITEEGIPF